MRAAARAADKRGPATRLLDDFLARFGCDQPYGLIASVYGKGCQPANLAALSEIVFHAAESADVVARSIIAEAAADLAGMVVAVARKLNFADEPFSLAYTGGVLLKNAILGQLLRARLGEAGLERVTIMAVPDPVAGAVRLATRLLGDRESRSDFPARR